MRIHETFTELVAGMSGCVFLGPSSAWWPKESQELDGIEIEARELCMNPAFIQFVHSQPSHCGW